MNVSVVQWPEPDGANRYENQTTRAGDRAGENAIAESPPHSTKLQHPLDLRPHPMAHLFFAASIQRHVPMPERDVSACSVDEALSIAFAEEPRLRGYILDDQGGLRRHLAVFVDGRPVRDRRRLSDAVESDSRIYVVQALSGG
jgi:sulfur-carrier protein